MSRETEIREALESYLSGQGISGHADAIMQIGRIESALNPNASAPTSSAEGVWQFIDSTWADMGGGNKFSIEDQARNIAKFTAQNINGFRNKNGRDPDGAELYLSHFGGLGTANKVAGALDAGLGHQSITSIMTAKQISANHWIRHNGKSFANFNIQDFYDWANAKMDGVSLGAVASIHPEVRQGREVMQNALHAMIRGVDLGIEFNEEQGRSEPAPVGKTHYVGDSIAQGLWSHGHADKSTRGNDYATGSISIDSNAMHVHMQDALRDIRNGKISAGDYIVFSGGYNDGAELSDKDISVVTNFLQQTKELGVTVVGTPMKETEITLKSGKDNYTHLNGKTQGANKQLELLFAQNGQVWGSKMQGAVDGIASHEIHPETATYTKMVEEARTMAEVSSGGMPSPATFLEGHTKGWDAVGLHIELNAFRTREGLGLDDAALTAAGVDMTAYRLEMGAISSDDLKEKFSEEEIAAKLTAGDLGKLDDETYVDPSKAVFGEESAKVLDATESGLRELKENSPEQFNEVKEGYTADTRGRADEERAAYTRNRENEQRIRDAMAAGTASGMSEAEVMFALIGLLFGSPDQVQAIMDKLFGGAAENGYSQYAGNSRGYGTNPSHSNYGPAPSGANRDILAGEDLRDQGFTNDPNKPYWVSLNAAGKPVAGNMAFEMATPMSTTKMATLLTISDMIKAGELPADFLERMNEIQVYDSVPWIQGNVPLVDGMMQRSSNAAPERLALEAAKAAGWGDSVDRFVERMNAMAEERGLEGTQYTNPVGLNTGPHYSTAYDVALVGYYLNKDHPEIAKRYADIGTDHTGGKFDGVNGTTMGKTGTGKGNEGRSDLDTGANLSANKAWVGIIGSNGASYAVLEAVAGIEQKTYVNNASRTSLNSTNIRSLDAVALRAEIRDRVTRVSDVLLSGPYPSERDAAAAMGMTWEEINSYEKSKDAIIARSKDRLSNWEPIAFNDLPDNYMQHIEENDTLTVFLPREIARNYGYTGDLTTYKVTRNESGEIIGGEILHRTKARGGGTGKSEDVFNGTTTGVIGNKLPGQPFVNHVLDISTRHDNLIGATTGITFGKAMTFYYGKRNMQVHRDTIRSDGTIERGRLSNGCLTLEDMDGFYEVTGQNNITKIVLASPALAGAVELRQQERLMVLEQQEEKAKLEEEQATKIRETIDAKVRAQADQVKAVQIASLPESIRKQLAGIGWDSDDNGKLTRAEIGAGVKETPATAAALGSAMKDAGVDDADANKDNELSADEITVALSKLSKPENIETIDGAVAPTSPPTVNNEHPAVITGP